MSAFCDGDTTVSTRLFHLHYKTPDVDRPTVPSFTVVGDAFSASRTVDVSALTSTDDSAFGADL
ncbi:hypothetical protein [Halogranum rubrum]|uniref:Uncharacterized protein n=1 Tax=Halogranum salarium B-1 TaxID=1210908 RepID=J3JHG6_9EURY|nr:hypothetical protein [Halogranum salarium]EJN60979.1 hypothetical protein HSB1_15820 [Halogranum salarium B-1]